MEQCGPECGIRSLTNGVNESKNGSDEVVEEWNDVDKLGHMDRIQLTSDMRFVFCHRNLGNISFCRVRSRVDNTRNIIYHRFANQSERKKKKKHN